MKVPKDMKHQTLDFIVNSKSLKIKPIFSEPDFGNPFQLFYIYIKNILQVNLPPNALLLDLKIIARYYYVIPYNRIKEK